jgi:hypothetical protein
LSRSPRRTPTRTERAGARLGHTARAARAPPAGGFDSTVPASPGQHRAGS